MADSIVNLNSYRRATAKNTPAKVRGKLGTGAGKNAAVRQARNKTPAPVLQIPTEANEKQRCEVAARKYKGECARAMGDAFERLADPLTGVLLVTATDLEGGTFHTSIGGVYWDDAEAALSTLEHLVGAFQEQARMQRNARAMAAAQPVKRPAFEVAL